MMDIKEYINGNIDAFGNAELPEGHEARFEAKLDAMLESTDKAPAQKRTRIFTGIFGTVAAVAAAVTAAMIFINRPADEIDWFAGVADNPTAVYLAYSEKITAMYEDIFTKDVDACWETTVASIAEETVPMIDLLPEELDEKEKAHILKEYYGELLNGLDKINKIKEL